MDFGAGGDTLMSNASRALARSITWSSSKQSYLTARLLADRDLAGDCLRAYAYFRWADDMIDVHLSGSAERSTFIERQKALVNSLYMGTRPDDLSPEEAMLADLIAHERAPESGLRSFIYNFMSVIELDAHRCGRETSRRELTNYTACLATAVMDGLQYFIGNGHAYPRTRARVMAVTGAHITHMLRDTLEDLSAGLVNIPAEYLAEKGLTIRDITSGDLRPWVRSQVAQARQCFQEGRTYIDSLEILRCKLAGVWYCARFECILNAIEADGYRLRADYPERHSVKVWLEMASLGILTTWGHYSGKIRSFFFGLRHQPGIQSHWNTPWDHIK
jgi:phytoene/squalene synthetase